MLIRPLPAKFEKKLKTRFSHFKESGSYLAYALTPSIHRSGPEECTGTNDSTLRFGHAMSVGRWTLELEHRRGIGTVG